MNEFNHNSKDPRNEQELRALQESGAHIARARFDSIPDASEFKGRLKAQLMAKRELKRTSMWQKMREALSHLIPTQKTFAVGFVVFLLMAVVTTTLLQQNGIGPTSNGIATLFIDRAYAKDNFEVTATSGDELAVDSTTEFIVKSKTALTRDALLPHLHLLPETPFDLKQVSDYEFRVTPHGTLKEKQVYNIKIDAAYNDENNVAVERDFSFAFQVKNQFKLLSSIPGTQQTGVPLNTGIELTFSSENFSDSQKYISIEPKVDGKWEVHGRTLVFVPKALKASTVYTVTVNKSLPVKGTEPLSQDLVVQFETAPKDTQKLGSYWYINNTKAEFSPNGPMRFTINAIEDTQEFTVKAFAFKSFDLYKKNFLKAVEIPGWAFETNKNFAVPSEDITLTREFTLKPESRQQDYTKYLSLPENLPQGDYWIEISTKNQSQHLFVEVTNLSSYVDVTVNKTLLWINNLSTKSPVQNAQITLAEGKSLGTTNDDGIAVIETELLGVSTSTKPIPYFKQGAGDDRHILQITSGKESSLLLTYGNSSMRSYSAPDRDHYILNFSSDRFLYLPNDTVKFWGFVQKRDGSIPQTLTVGIPNTSNYFYGRNLGDLGFLQSLEVHPDEQGYFHGELKLSNLTATGYALVIQDGETQIYNKYFEVSNYAKPAYTVSVNADKHAYFGGENVQFTANVNFFEGTSVPNYALTYQDGFGQNSGQAITDKNGDAKWSFIASARENTCNFLTEQDCFLDNSQLYQNLTVNNLNPEETPLYRVINYAIYTSKVDGKTEVIQKDKTTAVVSSTWYNIDLSPLNNEDYTDDDKYFASFVSQKHVDAAVFETHYEKRETGSYYDYISKTVVPTFSYEPVTTLVTNFSGETDNKGHFTAEFAIEQGHTYQVRMVMQDADGKKAIQVGYFSLYDTGVPNENVTWFDLRTSLDKKSYKIGEEVQIGLYKNGVELQSVEGKVLFTQLQRGLQTFTVGQNPKYKFTFGEHHVPNVYVGAVYFDGTRYNEIAEGTYRSNILFDSSERALNVKVETNKSSYKPGDQVKLTVETKDKNGDGHSARVNISVIDEAFLALMSGGFDSNVHFPAAMDPLLNIYQPLGDGTLFTLRSHKAADLGSFSGSEGGGCFLAGTAILLSDGTYKNIEKIGVGDIVGTLKSESDATFVSGQVLKTQKHIVSEYLVINGTLRVTPEHRILVNGLWQDAGKIQVGDTLRGQKGQSIKVVSLETRHELVEVYNFAVEKYHTYIAGGIYVHNEKGGTPTRSEFPDIALYQFIETDKSGNGQVTFKLPDSVTGWRITAEALAPDLYGGIGDKTVDVSMPVFGLFSVPQDLLIGDKPMLTAGGYGSGLQARDTVNFKFMGELFTKAQEKVAFAFEQIRFAGDKAVERSGKVRLEVDTKSGKDAIEKSFTAVNSRVVERDQLFVVLKNGTVDLGAAKSATQAVELKFVDAGLGSLYYRIADLSWNGGARLDQKVGSLVARDWFKDIVPEDQMGVPEGLMPYIGNTGFKLLPYSSEDLSLTVKAVAVLQDTDAFDKDRMRTALVAKFYDTNATSEELAQALWGSAALGEPVLPSIRTLAANENVHPQDKIYLALAATELGDNEYARTLYDELVKNVKQTETTAKVVFDSENKNEILENTALMSVLAVRMQDSLADKLDKFVQDEPKEILLNLESLLFVKEKMKTLLRGVGSLTLNVAGQKVDVKLKNGMSRSVTVAPVNFNALAVENLQGPVALIALYDKPVDKSQSSDVVKLTREYFINGKKVDSLKNGDFVEVRLTPVFGKDAPAGAYLIEDSLPSGLKFTSGIDSFSPLFSACWQGYPYEVDGQRIKFTADRYFQNSTTSGNSYTPNCENMSYLSYRARVSTLGEFRLEGALIQSLESPDVKNFSSDTGMIQITE